MPRMKRTASGPFKALAHRSRAIFSCKASASGAEVIDITQENGRQTRNLRMGLLTLNYGHNNEIYGSMVVYLRMKNIVPPASEPRPQQKK